MINSLQICVINIPIQEILEKDIDMQKNILALSDEYRWCILSCFYDIFAFIMSFHSYVFKKVELKMIFENNPLSSSHKLNNLEMRKKRI